MGPPGKQTDYLNVPTLFVECKLIYFIFLGDDFMESDSLNSIPKSSWVRDVCMYTLLATI